MEPNSDATIICTDGVCRLVRERDLTASRRALHRPSAVRQVMNGQRSVSTKLDIADLELQLPDHHHQSGNHQHGMHSHPLICLVTLVWPHTAREFMHCMQASVWLPSVRLAIVDAESSPHYRKLV